MLADPDSPMLITPAYNVPASMWMDEEQAARRSQRRGRPGGLTTNGSSAGWRPSSRTLSGVLVPQGYLPLDGVVERLEQGAKVADIGCGHGHSTVLMAEAFPNSTFLGIDAHEGSIAAAIDHAATAGVSDRVSFEVGTATTTWA